MERTTVGSVLRATQAWCLHLCEKETLDLGIAYYCDRFPELLETNQFREVIAEDPRDVAAALEEATRWFDEKKLRCHRWAPATGQASPALEEMLIAQGFVKRAHTVFALTSWPELHRSDRLRVLPVRAMRSAFYKLLISDATHHGNARRVDEADAWIERLDEPQLDLFVAMDGSTPTGYAGLFQVGDIARVLLPTVSHETAQADVADTLLDHMLALAKRLSIANVVTMLDAEDHKSRAWLEGIRFVADGTIVEFDRVAQAAEQ